MVFAVKRPDRINGTCQAECEPESAPEATSVGLAGQTSFVRRVCTAENSPGISGWVGVTCR
jgi:hypothetical protein